MIAGRANFGSFLADDNMSAVAAFPYFHGRFCEYFRRFDIFKQRAIAFFVMFFYCRHKTKSVREFGESFLFGGLCKPFVHIGPLVIFSRSGGAKIFDGVTDTVKFLRPKFSMLFFVFSRFQK